MLEKPFIEWSGFQIERVSTLVLDHRILLCDTGSDAVYLTIYFSGQAMTCAEM